MEVNERERILISLWIPEHESLAVWLCHTWLPSAPGTHEEYSESSRNTPELWWFSSDSCCNKICLKRCAAREWNICRMSCVTSGTGEHRAMAEVWDGHSHSRDSLTSAKAIPDHHTSLFCTWLPHAADKIIKLRKAPLQFCLLLLLNPSEGVRASWILSSLNFPTSSICSYLSTSSWKHLKAH